MADIGEKLDLHQVKLMQPLLFQLIMTDLGLAPLSAE